MLFSPTMRSTVLQATAISAITQLCHQYAIIGVLETLQENEGFSHFQRLYNESSSSLAAASKQAQLPQIQFNGLSPSNVTTTSVVEEPESFYGSYFPREILVAFFMSILQYWWFIGLEKMFPARPRYLNPSSSQEPAATVAVEDNEDREEKVVKKWIAQGRVRRASLNWCNTLLKWVLDMTVGQIWYDTTKLVITKLLKFQSPVSVFLDFKRHLIWHYGSVFLSTAPLAHLTAFIVVPAHKQLVFTQAISLLATVFFYTVFYVFTGWVVNTEYVQAYMKNVTMEAERNPEKWGIVGGGEL